MIASPGELFWTSSVAGHAILDAVLQVKHRDHSDGVAAELEVAELAQLVDKVLEGCLERVVPTPQVRGNSLPIAGKRPRDSGEEHDSRIETVPELFYRNFHLAFLHHMLELVSGVCVSVAQGESCE